MLKTDPVGLSSVLAMFRRRGPRGNQEGRANLSAERLTVLRTPRTWPPGWAGFERPWGDGDHDQSETFAAAFDKELHREVGPGHVLYGQRCLAIGKREATDDVLFAVGADQVAVVHLTWAQKPEHPPWPSSTLYGSFDEFLAAVPRDFGE